MDCRTAESMVNRYIDRTLNEKELDEFIQHIENCSSCYDELETYYIVHEATKQLDQEGAESEFNIKGLLEEDLMRTKKEVYRKTKMFRMILTVSGLLVTAFIAFFVRVVIGLI